jgi:hypothetical protein
MRATGEFQGLLMRGGRDRLTNHLLWRLSIAGCEISEILVD